MSFSQEQRVFILEHYFASRSYARVADEFRWRYPDSAVPNNSTITRLIDGFRECGSVADRKRSGRPTILTEAKLADMEGMMQNSPSESLRRLSAQGGILYRSAQKATRKLLHVRAYHFSCVQELTELDKDKRIAYYRWFQSFVDNHGIVDLDRVFITDEAWFHLSGYVNRQNSSIRSAHNPHVTYNALALSEN
jgi:hypothetical protein